MGKQFKKIRELGSVLYLGMGYCNGHKVVLSVGYTLPYALKKAQQFVEAGKGLIEFEKVRVIINGEKESRFALKPDGLTVFDPSIGNLKNDEENKATK